MSHAFVKGASGPHIRDWVPDLGLTHNGFGFRVWAFGFVIQAANGELSFQELRELYYPTRNLRGSQGEFRVRVGIETCIHACRYKHTMDIPHVVATMVGY